MHLGVYTCAYVCVQKYHFRQDFSPNWTTTTFQEVYPSNTLVVNATHIHLYRTYRLHTYTPTESCSIPSASSLSAHLLVEVAADVQGLLVHLSHVLHVPQQGEAAIVPRGAFHFGATAEFRSLVRWRSLESLEVGKMQQVFS